jgi:hypothetical protein
MSLSIDMEDNLLGSLNLDKYGNSITNDLEKNKTEPEEENELEDKNKDIDILDQEQEDIDDETRLLILKHINRQKQLLCESDIDNIKKNKTKIKKQNINKSINIAEFNKELEEKANMNKEKKFISKRADDKRKELGISDTDVQKRSFNPRKPPYNFVRSNDKMFVETIDIQSTTEFPSL